MICCETGDWGLSRSGSFMHFWLYGVLVSSSIGVRISSGGIFFYDKPGVTRLILMHIFNGHSTGLKPKQCVKII